MELFGGYAEIHHEQVKFLFLCLLALIGARTLGHNIKGLALHDTPLYVTREAVYFPTDTADPQPLALLDITIPIHIAMTFLTKQVRRFGDERGVQL